MIAELLLQCIRRTELAGKPALIWQDKNYTYQYLAEQCLELARQYQAASTVPRPRILLYLGNSLEYVPAWFSASLAGSWLAHLHASFSPETLIHTSEIFRPDILLIKSENRNKIDPARLACPVVLCIDELIQEKAVGGILNPAAELEQLIQAQSASRTVLFTSGSTGIPKGVVLPENMIPANAAVLIENLRLAENDTGAMFGPISMSMSLAYIYAHLKQGASILLEENFLSPNDILKRFEDFRVTGFSAVPTAIEILCTRCALDDYNLKPLRYIRIGAGKFNRDKISMLAQALPQVEIFKTYGLSEIGIVTFMSTREPEDYYDSVGRPVNGVKVEIVDDEMETRAAGNEGEIVVQAPYQMAEYCVNPEATSQVLKQGKIFTGDLGYLDEHGYLFITGRKKELIKIAGESVHPYEIEKEILKLAGVRECCVTAMPDKILGEAPKVYVTLDSSLSLTRDSILKHCRLHLPQRMLPKDIMILDKLPRTPSGKVDRITLGRI